MPTIKRDYLDCHQPRVPDRSLNAAVVAIARQLFPTGFEVSDVAPSTYEELVALFESGERYVVYAGGSDTTIFGDREVNYHFRAWHDWCHWKGCHDFSLQGERATFRMQCEHIVLRFGDDARTRYWRRVLWADVVGQKLYWKRHGIYPYDQIAFVKAVLDRHAWSGNNAAQTATA